MAQPKNIKREVPARVRVTLDLRRGSRTDRITTRPRGGRQGAKRAALQEG